MYFFFFNFLLIYTIGFAVLKIYDNEFVPFLFILFLILCVYAIECYLKFYNNL